MSGPAQPVREQRFVFGEVAGSYDRRRPSYPAGVIDAIVNFAGLGRDGTAFAAEVGAGTGKASVLFAARGLNLKCLEPSAAMAAVARENLAQFPNAEVVESAFEDWQPAAKTFALVFAAQSWHWISPEARYVQADRCLRPGGTLAVMWNVATRRGNDRIAEALKFAYGEIGDTRWGPAQSHGSDANSWVVGEIQESGLFAAGSPTIVREPWRQSYDTESWLELLSTQSDHRMLDEQTRFGLFDRVRAGIDNNGGIVEVDYVTVAYLAYISGGPDR